MRVPLSLRSKLSIALLLLLIPVLGLVIYHYEADSQLREAVELEGQLRTAQAIGAMVDCTFDQGAAVGKALAMDPVIRTFPTTDPSRLDPYLARYLPAYPPYESINVWDERGQNVAASVPLPPGEPRPNIADREHFQRAMASGEPAVSGVLLARTTGQPAAAVVVPIKDQAGRLIGALSVLLDLGLLPKHLWGIGLRPDQELFVADGAGMLAFHSAMPDLAWEQRDVSWYKPIAAALAQGWFAGRVERSLTGEPRLVTAARSPEHGWVAGASVPVETVLGEVRREMLPTLGIYLAIVVLAGLLAFGSTYTITRGLGDLTRAIAAFGRGELGRRVEIRTGDELETTAEVFNRMAMTLQREQDRLRFLGEMSGVLASAMELEVVVRLLAERSTQMLGEACWVYLATPGDERRLRFAAKYAREPGVLEPLGALIERHREWLVANLVAPVERTGEPILIRCLESSWLEPELRDRLVELNGTSLMVVPLLARGRCVGVMATLSLSEAGRLGPDELALAMDVGGRAGAVVENALLFRQVRDERLRLRSIVDTVPAGVMVAEAPSGRIIVASRESERILGRPVEAAAPIDRWPLVYGLHRLTGEPYPPGGDPLARALLHGEFCAGEEMLIRQPSGREVVVLMRAAPLGDGERRLAGGVAAFQDITPLKDAQRRMEELAREAERRSSELDAVIEGVDEGITIADGDGRIVRVNSRGREIWGHLLARDGHPHVSELAGRIDLRYPDDRPMPFDEWPILRALRGEVFSGLEAIYCRPDGKKIHLLFSSGVVRDEGGRVRLAVNVYGDITPIREFEMAREEFISVVAHDLRAPLTVITGFAGILRRLPPEQHGQAQEQRALDSILSSTRRLERMVGDLLDASRLEARRLELTREPVDLPRLVRDVVERMAETVRGHPVRVEVRGDVPSLHADPARLEQVLGNLLSNAAKYSYPATEILLEVDPRPGEVMVSVTNQGPGIAPEDRDRIFIRFHRTRAAERVPGLGLGLYISKGLVEAHGGRIWVESEVGKYATFRFTLPLKAEY